MMIMLLLLSNWGSANLYLVFIVYVARLDLYSIPNELGQDKFVDSCTKRWVGGALAEVSRTVDLDDKVWWGIKTTQDDRD